MWGLRNHSQKTGRAGPGAVAALCVALVTSFSTTADARKDTMAALAKVPVREMEVVADDTLLYASVSFVDLFDARMRKRLSSGFTTTLALRAYLFEVDTERPVALAVRTVKMRFDMWDERYLVKASDSRGVTNESRTTEAEALALAASIRMLPVAPLAVIDPTKVYFLAIRVEVDPTSKEVLEEYTKWITRPGGARPPAGSKSFFGSFVSLFVNPKADRARDVVAFRSILFRVILPRR